MKKLSLIIFALLITGCERKHPQLPLQPNLSAENDPPRNGSPAHSKERKIVILYGQSNMLGVGQTEPFIINESLTLIDSQPFGSGVKAASLLADFYPSWNVIAVQCAVGGKPIADLMPGTPIYTDCIAKVNAEVNKGGTIIGMFYYQGESDARDFLNLAWGSQFNCMVNQFRNQFHFPTMPVVWAQIGAMDYEAQYLIDNWKSFQDMQETVHIQNAVMIITKDQPIVGHVHHDFEANKIIGERMYRALRGVI